nr:hypothetical protein [Nanoarchaeum sp.]
MNKKARIKFGIVLVFFIFVILLASNTFSEEIINDTENITDNSSEIINISTETDENNSIIDNTTENASVTSPIENQTNLTILTYNFNEIEQETTTILDERTEQTCNGNTCEWTQYAGNKFYNYNNEFYYFSDYTTSHESEGNFNQNTLGNTEITLTPVVNYQDSDVEIADLPNIIGDQLNYRTTVNQYRDNTKFSINFNTLENLNRIGFKVTSNKPIRYFDYNYTPEGIYEIDPVRPVEIPNYQMTDLIIGELRYSFVDLVESNFDIEYDKTNDILWINLEGLDGNIEADPVYTFYSESQDGSLYFNPTCSGAMYDTANTLSVAADSYVNPAIIYYAYFMFDTSTINNYYTLNSSSLTIYAHSYASTKYYNPVWNVSYSSNKGYLGSLDCSDSPEETVYNPEGWFNYNGTTSWKSTSINVSSINTTGFTNFELIPGWTPAAGQYGDLKLRTSEYPSYQPYLNITYTIPEFITDENQAKQAIEQGINSSILSNSQDIKTNRKINLAYSNNTQKLGNFDKFVTKNNQIWVFNYVTANETYTNMTSVRKVVNIWESSSLSYEQIVSQVSGFINNTYI